MGFVGNYAPRELSPQTDGMPVILKRAYRISGKPLYVILPTYIRINLRQSPYRQYMYHSSASVASAAKVIPLIVTVLVSMTVAVDETPI